MVKNYDFAGWATRNDVRCSDGRVIMRDAFAEQNGKSVPLVWNHQHDSVDNVLGHAVLENRDEGVYAYCSFNDSPSAQVARQLVKHGDITSLSIYANQLKHNGTNVTHGLIREVSMVLAGANPQAFIDSVLTHSADGSEMFADDGTIYTGMPLDLMHSDTKKDTPKSTDEDETDPDDDVEVVGDDDADEAEAADDTDDSEDNASESESKADESSSENQNDKKKKTHVVEDKSEDVVDKLGKSKDEPKKDSKADTNKSDDSKDASDNKDNKEENMANTMSHSDEDMTVADVIDGMTDKQKVVVFYVISQALKPYGIELDDAEDLGLKSESDEVKHADSSSDETIGDVLDTLSETQMNVVKYIIGQILQDNGITEEDVKKANSKNSNDDEEDEMSHNVFDREVDPATTLMHSADCDFATMMTDARQYGTLSQSMLAHGADIDNFTMGDYIAHADYGMENIDVMFPDAKAVSNQPFMVTRDLNWVPSVMGSVNHTPFSRIKSLAADLTEDEARAKGYIKGRQKKNEVFALFKRVTTPTTVYKKQKLDRDDMSDITDFDVVVWLKAEMRTMLDEEIARAILIGDGRETSSEDKINEQNIRPIWTDDSVYTIKQTKKFTAEPSEDDLADSIIESAVRARKSYRGSGNPVLFTTEDNLTSMLLMKDKIGHRLYPTTTELAAAMRVSAIYTVPEMEGKTRTPATSETDLTGKTPTLDGIIVNLKDYTVGTDKGGAVSMFDDFDIDYNQQKYLIETRISGALTVPYSAIVLEHYVSA